MTGRVGWDDSGVVYAARPEVEDADAFCYGDCGGGDFAVPGGDFGWDGGAGGVFS